MWRSSSDALGISKNALCMGFEHLHKKYEHARKTLFVNVLVLYFRILSK